VGPGTLLWLAAIGVVALLAAMSARRVGHLAGGTFELQRFQNDLRSIDQRLAAVVEPLTGRLDEARRGARDPGELGADVDAARATLRELSRDARALKAPSALADRSAQVVWELDRAVRAADMAGHGIGAMARSRMTGSTEAQVALKRGTLGLRHAREAVTRIVAGVAVLTPAEVRAMPAPSLAALSGGIPTPSTDEELLTGPDDEE